MLGLVVFDLEVEFLLHRHDHFDEIEGIGIQVRDEFGIHRHLVFINPEALETITSRVDAAVASGARILAGGSAEGPCFQPTLLADVPADSEFANIETFGPVAAIEIVDSPDEAVERANATPYGLSSGIITTDVERGMALAQAIDAGIVHVNDQPVGDEPQMPFGGVKDSGFGRFGGTAVVDEFTETRWITVQRGSHPFPF